MVYPRKHRESMSTLIPGEQWEGISPKRAEDAGKMLRNIPHIREDATLLAISEGADGISPYSRKVTSVQLITPVFEVYPRACGGGSLYGVDISPSQGIFPHAQGMASVWVARCPVKVYPQLR
jgi:hypothetical protein